MLLTEPDFVHAIHARRLAVTLVAILVSACGGDGPSALMPRPGITVVASPTASDTVQATPVQALILVVADSTGEPAAGVVVRFEGGTLVGPSPWLQPAMSICPVTATSCPTFEQAYEPFTSAVTDSRGRATVIVRYGTIAGDAYVRATVPELGLRDSIRFVVQPGAAAGVRLLPADTAMRQGTSVSLRGAVRDRFGNVRADPVRYSAASGAAVTVDGAGKVTAVSVGRAEVIAAAGDAADSAIVSVVPEGMIAALPAWSSTGPIVTMSLDGSNRREYSLPGGGHPGTAGLSWSADGTRLLFGGYPNEGTMPLSALDVASGSISPIIVNPPGTHAVWWGRYSKDGQWVYFNALVTGRGWSLYRIGADGTGDAERLLPEPSAGTYEVDWRHSVSPDGKRLAYESQLGFDYVVRVLDVETRTVHRLDVRGRVPAFSPDGRLIAFIGEGGSLCLMNADGSNQRVVSTAGAVFYDQAIDWSPDGRFLIALGAGPFGTRMQLVEVSTGEALPVALSQPVSHPAWKR